MRLLGGKSTAAIVLSLVGGAYGAAFAQNPAAAGAAPTASDSTPASTSPVVAVAPAATVPQPAQPAAPQSPQPEKKTYTVPAGTKVLLQLRSGINTRSARPGDGVYLASTFPVVVGNRVMIPSGVYVQGVVDRVARAGRVKGRAQLDMHFTAIIFPNGTVVEIPGIVNSLPGAKKQSVKDDGEGTIEQSGDKGRKAGDTAKIAIPAGGSIGSIAGISSGHSLAGGLAGLAA